MLGGTRVLLYPLFHPAAALYTPRMLDVLAGRLRAGCPSCSGARRPPAPRAGSPSPPAPAAASRPAVQLGLF